METQIVEITQISSQENLHEPVYFNSGESTSSDETESSSASMSANSTPPSDSNLKKYIEQNHPIPYKTALSQDRSSNKSSSNTVSDRSLSDIFGRTFVSGTI